MKEMLILEGISGTWVPNIIQGYAISKPLYFLERQILVTLISRKRITRGGPEEDGIDDEGDVAQEVETEMIIRGYDFELSQVMGRSQIPVFYKQTGDGAELKRERDLEAHPFEKYINRCKEEAKNTILFNLLDVKEESERLVSERYVELFNLKTEGEVNLRHFNMIKDGKKF